MIEQLRLKPPSRKAHENYKLPFHSLAASLASAATGIRHIGPMAQDFHAVFGVGADEKAIATLDESGVVLAAIRR